MTKLDIRRKMRSKRMDFSASIDPQYAAKQAALHLAQTQVFMQSQRIAVYLPMESELDTQRIVQMIWQYGKRCYLPLLAVHAAPSNKRMRFAYYKRGTRLLPNSFGIMQPVPSLFTQYCAPQHLDLVLLPLIAFDDKGGRIGMGAGYYDCTFQFMQKTRPVLPKMVGLAYSWQRTELFTGEPWDIILNMVVTERGVLYSQ